MELDQFFTPIPLAQQCMTWLNEYLQTRNFQLPLCFIEPSAGKGSFYNLLERGKRIGFELDPVLCIGTEYLNMDFLNLLALPPNQTYVACGNPPFSCGTTLTKRKKNVQACFLQHCESLGCEVIGMIFGANMHRIRPKPLVANMKLVRSYALPNTCFLSNKNQIKRYNVVFDIYERSNVPVLTLDTMRQMETKPRDWKLVSSFEEFDIAFFRWGGNCCAVACNVPMQERWLTRTQSRYFFVKYCGTTNQQFLLFLNYVRQYIVSVSVITTSSISMYELYSLWEAFLVLSDQHIVPV